MKRIAILVVAISLGTMAGVACALTAATNLGSDIVYLGTTIPDSSWTECISSGPVADAYGKVYQTVQGVCGVGEPLPFVLPIGSDVFKPDWKRCMIRNYFKAYALAHGILCDDILEGTIDAVPYIYWNNAGALNLSTVSSFAAVAGSWTGGVMNNSGAFQYPYSYDGYHPNVGTIPYIGIPYINMPVQATTRTHGAITGKIINTARSLKITYFVSDTFTAESAWFTGSLFEVGPSLYTNLDVADEGGAVYNNNVDQHGNPCEQRDGTILEVIPAGTAFWATNYYTNDLVTLASEYSKQGRNTPGLHPAGTCIPQSATPTMVTGAKLMTDTAAQQLQVRYAAMSRFLTEPRLAMFRSMPGVQRISDTADERSVEIGYYCEPGESCDVRLIRDEILASVDVETATVAEAMGKHRVSGLKVVVEHYRYDAGRKPKR